MSIYDDMRETAGEILSDFAQGSISYIGLTNSGGTVDNPGEPVEANPVAINAVASGVSFKFVQAGLAIETDLQVIVPAASGIVPEIGRIIQIDGVKYTIMQIVKNPAAGTVVTYTCIVRR